MRIFLSISLLLTLSLLTLTGQAQLKWTGLASNNDFFDETNWIITSTELPPTSGSIDPDQNIDEDLVISDVDQTIIGSGNVFLGIGSITIDNAELKLNQLHGGTVIIQERGYIDLTSSSPLANNVIIDFHSGVGWIRTLAKTALLIHDNHLSQFKINGLSATYITNLRIDNYYFEGAVIRSNDKQSTKPLSIFSMTSQQGISTAIQMNDLFKGRNIPDGMDNKTSSFILRKGFEVTLATNETGLGKSKTYIASEKDLVLDQLPNYLQNNVSFIRVIPWNWVNKKGNGGPLTGLDETWHYLWSSSGNSVLDRENTPMAWGKGNIDSQADINNFIGKHKTPHALAFNEPDDCNAQSGQFGNLCQTDVASVAYLELMKTGLRLVSPSCREEAPFGWLSEFYDKAVLLDGRVDVIGVHWYDWGSSPAGSPNADPQSVFNRFKSYLTNVHNHYNLPIWITEFNANPNRTAAVNLAFMQLALPYLETLDYVERYAWFQPSSGVANYYDGSGDYTTVGQFYKDHVSTPSIPEDTYAENSSIDILYGADGTDGNLMVNGDFEDGISTQWKGFNNGTITNTPYEGTTAGRILAGSGSLFRVEKAEPNLKYELSFYSRWFVSPTAPLSVSITDEATGDFIATKTLPSSTSYELVVLDFIIPTNVNEINIKIAKDAGQPGWFVDNMKLKIAKAGIYHTWKGTANNSWSNASNWDLGIVPDGSNNVIIENTGTPPIINSGSYTVNELAIEDGAVLTINGNASLTILEDLVAITGYADVIFGASLLLKGDATGANHKFSRATTFNDTEGKYSIIGSPITNATTNALGALVYEYDESKPYGMDGSTRFSAVIGVNMSPGDAYFSAYSGIVIFEGTPNTGEITQMLTYSSGDGSNAGYNLVSNPYTSAIDFDLFMIENSTLLESETIYLWDDGGSSAGQRSNSDYIVANTIGATRISINGRENGWDEGIRSTQGFFVKSNQQGSLKFTPQMMIETKNDASGFYRQDNRPGLYRIALSSKNGYSDIVIGLQEDASTGLDKKYDAALFSENADLKFYSMIDEQPFAIQGLPLQASMNTVNLGYKSNSKEEETLTISLKEKQFDDLNVYLKDHVTNQLINLSKEDYQFVPKLSSHFPRFQLTIAKENLLLSETDLNDQTRVFITGNELNVQLDKNVDMANVRILDLSGRLVRNERKIRLTDGKGQISFVQQGIFIVKIETVNGVMSQKVMSRN